MNCLLNPQVQGDQKVSVYLTITVPKKHAKIQYFKQFVTYYDNVVKIRHNRWG